MIPNQDRFIEAMHEKKKVSAKFYSQADSGFLNRICAPLDYGPAGETQDELNRYWLWDYESNLDGHTLGLLPAQIVDLRVLGEVFDPAQFGAKLRSWPTPRDWGSCS
ncbi:MAG: hypothetical protein HY043_05295 [Verrucomicrobia bacterium]|nr:hypothetical protein [Verrucomicrobiota bacterium]